MGHKNLGYNRELIKRISEENLKNYFTLRIEVFIYKGLIYSTLYDKIIKLEILEICV